jgi:tetratricopeptide (TPR) repeat protein
MRSHNRIYLIICIVTVVIIQSRANAQESNLNSQEDWYNPDVDYNIPEPGEPVNTDAERTADPVDNPMPDPGPEVSEEYADIALESYNKGVEYFNRKEWSIAVNHFRNAVKYNRNMSVYKEWLSSALQWMAYYYNSDGNAYYYKRDWANAIKYYKLAIKTNPNESSYNTNLNNAIEQQKMDREKERIIQQNRKNFKTYLNCKKNEIEIHGDQVTSIRKSIKSYVPPLSKPPKKEIADGIIFGMMTVMKEFESNKPINAFTGKTYNTGEYFTTTVNESWTDIWRCLLDNVTLGKYTLNHELGRELVKNLNGTHFGRLTAHSNGATIAEALLQEGVITTDELNIIEGDRSTVNFEGYKKLIESGKVKKIVVWINTSDFVPVGSSIVNLLLGNKYKEDYYRIYQSYIKNKLLDKDLKKFKIEYRYLDDPDHTLPSIDGHRYKTNVELIQSDINRN